MKYLIIGLGNPGEEYIGTRHNIGFDILDYLSNQFQTDFTVDKYGSIANFKIKGRTVFLLKPSTFMNLSGKSVRYHLLANKIKIDNLLVVSDDLHLSFGTIRFKRKGSDGGHNGHKDIIEKLHQNTYPRLKFGIGNDFYQGQQSQYVLDKWSIQESELLNKLIVKCSNSIVTFCTLGIDEAMKEFN